MFFTARIDNASPLKLTVNNTSGDVFIAPEDVTEIEIEATLVSGTPNEGDHGDWIFDADGNTVSLRPNFQIGQTVSTLASKVKSQLKEGFRAEDWDLKNLRGSFDAAYDLVVRIPREIHADSSITARTASGDVTIRDLTANVSSTTASGDSHLTNLTGRVAGHAASGDIHLENIHGTVEANVASGDIALDGGEGWCALRSASGDIQARNFTLKNARVATVNGDISFDVTMNNDADYTFDTVNGDTRLTTTLPASGATLTFKAVSGDAKVAGEWINDGKNTWHLSGGSKGPRIAMKALRGDLRATAITSDNVSLMHDVMPKDVEQEFDTAARQEHLENEMGRMDEKVSANEASANGGSSSTSSATSDVDWDRAKGWLKDITGKVSQFVAEMDEAGERRRGMSHGASSQTRPTEPVVVEGTIAETPSDDDLIVVETTPDNEGFTAETTEFETMASTPDLETTPFDAHGDSTPVDTQVTDAADIADSMTDSGTETTAQRRIRLLEAVKRGEMTVDEALAQLDDDPTA